MIEKTDITRVEIIDETGRVFSRWNQNVTLSYQDEGRTLKIFIESKKCKNPFDGIFNSLREKHENNS